MKAKRLISVTLAILIGSIFLPGCEISAIDCDQISIWTRTNPSINQKHVFCGEWNHRKNRPAGFHSRPAGANPTTVGTLRINQPPNSQGIYGVRWSFAGHTNREKFSSMFPDTCNQEQILKSIVYAAKHQKYCPDGAPRWAKCGPNQPTKSGQGYCEAADNSVFTIAFATLKNSSKINTAFPLVE
jgi:hypothetical protein